MLEKLNFLTIQLKNFKKNENFRSANPNVKIPPNFYLYETFGLDYNRYFYGGKDTALWVVKHLQNHKDFRKNSTILDWGCGPGRVIRHLPNIMGPSHRYFGTDYNKNYVTWCTKNISGVQFNHNQLSPPLNFTSNYFDAIYGISIFTHLSLEMHLKWIQELSRITKPTGIVLITTHGLPFLHKLTTREQKQFNEGKLVEHSYKVEGNRLFAAYQPFAYFENLCTSNGFVVLKHISSTNYKHQPKQDTWIIQKEK